MPILNKEKPMEAAKQYGAELETLEGIRETAFEMVKANEGNVNIAEFDGAYVVTVVLRIPKQKKLEVVK